MTFTIDRSAEAMIVLYEPHQPHRPYVNLLTYCPENPMDASLATH